MPAPRLRWTYDQDNWVLLAFDEIEGPHPAQPWRNDELQRVIDALQKNGIAMKDVTDKLLVEGLASFQKSFDTLLSGLQAKRKALAKELVSSR